MAQKMIKRLNIQNGDKINQAKNKKRRRMVIKKNYDSKCR